MSRERKFTNYKIITTYRNGEKESIKFSGINNTSYTDMLAAYKDYKEKISTSDGIVKIDFCGISKSGELKIMWTKPFTKEKNPFDKIESILENVKQYQENFNNYERWYKKRLDELLHDVENSKFISNKDLDNYKKKIFNSIFELREERRDLKNKYNAVSKIFKDGSIDLNNLSYISSIWDRRDNFTEEDINENIKCYRIYYNSKEEKQQIINGLRFKGYDNILELPEKSIGYYQTITNKTIEEKNIIREKLDKAKNSVIKCKSNELDTMLSAVNTIYYGQKVKGKKGSSIQVQCTSGLQIEKTINNNKSKYEKCFYIEDKNIVRLINRK